jgi:aminoglycoside phosphotransferase (APT) family kinase protein
MWVRIHDDEADTHEAAARALLREQCRSWAELPMSYVDSSGTDNAMWRLHQPDGDDLLLRLPRIPGAARGVSTEIAILPTIANALRVPNVRHAGSPTDSYPYQWAVLDWLDGTDAWEARDLLESDDESIALDLASAISTLATVSLDMPLRQPGYRGGPLGPVLDSLERWLDDPQRHAEDLLDVAAVRRSAAESREIADMPVRSGFLHGDLIPGNILVKDGRLSAIIDWGGAGRGDPAQDLGVAWSVLRSSSRRIFRDALEIDQPTWLRARAFELEHAVAAFLYYTPRGHQLADVMRRTLLRILTDG